MAQLGIPYRIMYLSVGRRPGLRDIYGAVLKPDKSIAGIFPLVELPGLLSGCYIYDYQTLVSDDPGDYFSIVISPSEANKTDIVRFELELSGGTVQAQQQITGVTLEGILTRDQITAIMPPAVGISGKMRNDNLLGEVPQEKPMHGLLDDSEMLATIDANSNLKGEINEQFNLP